MKTKSTKKSINILSLLQHGFPGCEYSAIYQKNRDSHFLNIMNSDERTYSDRTKLVSTRWV